MSKLGYFNTSIPQKSEELQENTKPVGAVLQWGLKGRKSYVSGLKF